MSDQHPGRGLSMSIVTRRRERLPERQYYDVAEVAAIIGISKPSLYRIINEGGFPAVRIRGRVFVPRRAIEEMTESAVAGQTVVDAADWVPDEVA